MGDVADEHLDYLLRDVDDEANFDPERAPMGPRDWHKHRSNREPRCGADQWRTKDRNEIMYMHEMTDSHLGHCIRFASSFPQHASRLASLLAERQDRNSKDRTK